MLNLATLNPEQRDAVVSIHGPVLILAGAGTGKTRVITFRIGHMIERGVAPGNILAVTFTNKAAREMQERVNKLLPKPARTSAKSNAGDKKEKEARPTIATFHSLCMRILRVHIEKLGYKRNFVIYDTSDQLNALKKILGPLSGKGDKTDANAVLSLISKIKNGGARAAAMADPGLVATTQFARPRYDSALRACNAVDFDDLILLTLKLFKEHPGALEACREHYQFIMVDEYQDTNAAQFQLMKLLAQQHRNLCVVGDDDQSIYGWRGAEIANLMDLEKHFPEVKVVKLEQNYRSTSVILSAANAVIKHNAMRRPKQLWSDKGEGSKIGVHTFSDDEEEARAIVEQIDYNRMAHGIPWGAHAILFRTNMQSRAIETALRAANVRYHIIGGQSYFDRREIKDLLSYLKTFVNPDDDINLLRIANVPARGLSDATMEKLLASSHERKTSVYATMRHTDVLEQFNARTRESIQLFLKIVEETRAPLQADPRLPLKPWTEKWLADIGYLDDLRRSEKNQEIADMRLRNIKDLVATMDRDEGMEGEPTVDRLLSFLEDVTLDNDKLNKEEDKPEDAVTMITMHSCKGLEFPHVYIVGLEEGLLPHSRSRDEGTLDEERRLFYVAITRAMVSLNITHCAGRKKYGQVMASVPSPFLKELPTDLIEWITEKTRKPVTVTKGKSLFDVMRAAAT